MFLSQKLFIVNEDGSYSLASPVSCLNVLKTWGKNMKIKISHMYKNNLHFKRLIMYSHEGSGQLVLDNTTTTMLAIFPTAASIQLA